ncbi:Glutathione S-transferase [Quillaja saponaria]|uniref:Glutathione S-transferase n=1 Tax=Quillaja saponaria TaxID=32244 RepID=A0AAD7LQF6_QUISA|nr:Glutathione S-transferase [Quillaja saponaria]
MSSKTTLNSPIKESSSSINSSSSASKLVLYSFWQSSCSWRVRFALNLKGLLYEYKAVNLTKGEHYGPVVDDDIVLSDSYAILLYLEEKYTQKPLLPVNPWLRALNLQVASIINSSIQPLHMMAILMYMEKKLGIREPQLFAQSAIEKGLYALERLLKDVASTYATGEEVYMADVFLAPQIAVASTRFSIDMSKFPTLSRIYESYKALPEFQASSPESQPDACNTPMPQHHRLIESVTGAPVPNK